MGEGESAVFIELEKRRRASAGAFPDAEAAKLGGDDTAV